jgi:hypothetical protein
MGLPWRRLSLIIVVVSLLLGTAPPAVSHATDAPQIGGIDLKVTSAAGWPVYYDAEVPPSAVHNVVAAIELSVAEIPRVTGLPAPSAPVVTYVLADRDRFRLAVAEHRGSIVDEVSEKANGLAMWRDGEMRVFLKMPEVESPASAAGFVSHELAHVTVAQAAAFRPMTQWLNEGYAEVVRHAVVQSNFPDAAEMLVRLHELGLASGLQRNGGPLSWSSLVTSPRFSGLTRAGYGQMAYGQSAKIVQILLDRYGPASVPAVFRAIGQGASPTEAFVAVFGSFAPHSEAFDAAVADLPARFPPGVYRLAQHARADGIPALAIVAGETGEHATVEVFADGLLVERQELVLDPVGFGRIVLSDAVTPGAITVRVEAPSLGRHEVPLVIEPAAQFHQDAVPAEAPAAPVQLPKAGRVFTPPANWPEHLQIAS